MFFGDDVSHTVSLRSWLACSSSASRRKRGIVMFFGDDVSHTVPLRSWLLVPRLLRDARGHRDVFW